MRSGPRFEISSAAEHGVVEVRGNNGNGIGHGYPYSQHCLGSSASTLPGRHAFPLPKESTKSRHPRRTLRPGADPLGSTHPVERGGSLDRAHELCAGCSVRPECLSYALEEPELLMGEWGGVTQRGRRAMRKLAG